MSTTGARNYRPLMHYTPPKGWINDPNGLVWDGSAYHLFAQHFPDATRPGPMHWLHAVSRDLIHWEDKGVALAPDSLGVIFSGSAVWDRENTSGLGKGAGPIVAMFTHHGEAEQQSIAYAVDGVHFTKYPGNPVIKNPGLRDFRDPKVLPNPLLGGWSAVVAAGKELFFYHSRDLIHWEKTGAFGGAENRMGGIFECPDLFPLPSPGGGTQWVLTASMSLPGETGGSRMQYFLGEFDGYAFRRTIALEEPALLDTGYDNYAAVTFDGIAPALQMGWGASWTYAERMPTGEYCGQMTLARRLSLVRADGGVRLAAQPVLPPIVGSKSAADGASLPGEVFLMDLQAEGPFEARLVNKKGERFAIGCDADGQFYTDRSRSGEMAFDPLFNSPLYFKTRRRRLMSGPVRMRVVFDRSIAEIFADEGTYANATLVFPTAPYETLELSGAAAVLSRLDTQSVR